MALFVLSLCPFDISVGVGAFVIGLGQISSFLSYYRNRPDSLWWVQRTLTKYCTKLLIERLKPDTISSKTKWDIKLNFVLDDEKWVKINNQTFQLSDDTLLRTFQYKINNRILYTNDKRYIFKLTDTELCSFYTETKDTLLHHLWECHFVKTLWKRLKEAFNNALQTNILLQPELFIFNIYSRKKESVS